MRAQKPLIGHGSHLIVSQQPRGGGTVALIWFRVGARPGRTRIYALCIVASHLTLTCRTATHIHCTLSISYTTTIFGKEELCPLVFSTRRTGPV